MEPAERPAMVSTRAGERPSWFRVIEVEAIWEAHSHMLSHCGLEGTRIMRGLLGEHFALEA